MLTRAREAAHEARFRLRYGFPLPPPHTYLGDYGFLLDVLRSPQQRTVAGDWLEIGVFLGGGTYQLCKAAPSGTRVIAVDVFERGTDATQALDGRTMDDIYVDHLGYVAGRLGTAPDQEAIFRQVTAGLENLVVVVGDSRTVELPTERLAFAYIDGNHAAEYVRSDFERAWALLSPGGIIALDDYGHAIPEVTRTVHELVGEHAAEIDRFWSGGSKTALVRRRA